MAVGQIISRAIATGAIGADQIATGAITAADIPAGEITADKLHQTLDFSTKTFTMANAHVTQAMVTQHQSALSVTESQVSDLQSYVLPNTSPTFTNTTLTGYLAGPASFVIDPAGVGDNTGTVVIAGNLQVDGTQTTINSTTVSIDDLKLSVATDAADSAAANGAGITVGGANANITYTHATTSWDFDKPVNVTGTVTATGGTMTGDVNFGDTNKAIFGAGSDLQIFHWTNNASYIQETNPTNSLFIEGADVYIRSYSEGDNMIIAERDGAVTLHYDNAAKLATTSTGIDVTGIAVADEINLDGGGDIHSTIDTGYVGIAGGTNSNVGANALFYGGSHSSLAGVTKFRSGSTTNVTILSSGNVGIGTDNPSNNLAIDIAANNTGITLSDHGDGFFPQIIYNSNRSGAGQGLGKFSSYWNGTEVARIEFAAGSDATNKDDGAILFNTKESGASLTTKVKIETNGNVGIGTTNPSATLQITPPNEHQNSFRIYRGGSSGYQLNYLNMSLYLGNTVFNTTSTDTSGKRYLFQINGTEKFRIDQNGEVGIGTTNPLRKLHISDAGDTHIMLQSTNALDNSEIFEIGAGANSANKVDLTFRTRLNSGSGGTEHMRITNDGYVTTPNQPAFGIESSYVYSATSTGEQVFNSSTVYFNQTNIRANIGSHWSSSTGRFTAPVAGNYSFTFNVDLKNHSSGYLLIRIRKNGSQMVGIYPDQTSPKERVTLNTVLTLATGDYIDVSWNNNYATPIFSYASFSGFLIG